MLGSSPMAQVITYCRPACRKRSHALEQVSALWNVPLDEDESHRPVYLTFSRRGKPLLEQIANARGKCSQGSAPRARSDIFHMGTASNQRKIVHVAFSPDACAAICVSVFAAVLFKVYPPLSRISYELLG